MSSSNLTTGKKNQETQYIWHPHVATRTLDDTAFILMRSRMVRLNTVGTILWDTLQAGCTLSDMVAVLQDEYAVEELQAKQDIMVFIDTMIERGLLTNRTE